MNGLFLDLYPDSRGRALNLLHLFFSLGALASPLVVGRFVEAGVAWQAIILGTAVGRAPARGPVRGRRRCRPGDMHGRAGGRCPRRARLAAHRAGRGDRLLRRLRDRRLELAGPLPRVGHGRPGDVGARAVLGLPGARPAGQRALERPVRSRPVRRHRRARRGSRARRRRRSSRRCRPRSSCSASSASPSARSIR